MSQRKHRVRLMWALAFAMVVIAVPVQANSLSVCPVGCAFTSIQAALAAANPGGGDEIAVGAGVFVGPIQVGIPVTITGVSAAVTVIGGGIIVGGVGIRVDISNLTLTQGLNGLAVLGVSDVVLHDAVVAQNISDGVLVGDLSTLSMFNVQVLGNGTNVAGNPIGAGISANGAATITTSLVTVAGNVSAGVTAFGQSTVNLGTSTNVVGNGLAEGIIPGFGGEGVVYAGQSTGTVDGALVQGNGSNGIAVLESATVTVRNSRVEANMGNGIKVGGPASVNPDVALTATATLVNNFVAGNAGNGILVGDPGKVLEHGVATVEGNGLTSNGGCGIAVDSGGTLDQKNNTIQNNAGGSICQI